MQAQLWWLLSQCRVAMAGRRDRTRPQVWSLGFLWSMSMETAASPG